MSVLEVNPTIDLNADLGEGEAVSEEDRGVMSSVTSVSIACGFHAGSREVMHQTILACLERNLVVGAHVSYRDREGFGRRSIEIEPERLCSDVVEQFEALLEVAGAAGADIAYVKPHGALYNDMLVRQEYAQAVVAAIERVGGSRLVCQHLEPVLSVAGLAGVEVVAEGFPDRGYRHDGRLASRAAPGGLVEDVDEAAARAVALAASGHVDAVDGGRVDVAVRTLCIHGDSEGAALRARRVRLALEAAGLVVAPFVPS